MKKLLAILILTASAFGQGGVHNGIALKSTGAPAGGATVRVCTSSATGTPCTPLATLYSDSALTVPLSNPISADASGNYSYFATAGLYKEQVTVGTSTFTSIIQITKDITDLYPLSASDGTAGTFVTNRDTGGTWTVKRYDNTNQYGPTKSPFSNAYIGSNLWVESHAGSNNADQFFGISSFMMVGTTPVNSSSNHSDSKVAGYFAARRDPGSLTSSGVTGINTNVDLVEDSAQGDFSIEADMNNGTGVNYTISGTSASKDGVVVASGGSNRPRWGIRTASTNDATNAWDGGAFIAGWYTKGIVVKPSVSATGTIGLESQAKSPAATSIATEQSSPYIAWTSNRWDDNASLSYFDMWKMRAETISHGAGTAGTSAFYLYDPNGNKVARFVNNSGSAELLQVGGSSVIAQGQLAVTTFTSNPGIRVTPGDDLNSTEAAIAITNAADNTNNALITKAGKGQFNAGIQPASTGTAITWFQKATHASLDLASVATAACTSETTETITGAALGDSCNVSAGTALEAGGFFRCAVTATDTVKWQLCNLSGGAIDRASDTYTIRVTR